MIEEAQKLIGRVANFFVDGKHAITKRLGVGLIILGLAFVIDDQVGITYFYATNQKIDQAQRIATIISNDSIDTGTRTELRKLQLTILRRKGFVSQSWDFIKAEISSRTNQTASTKPTSIIDVRSNIFYHVISSSWLLLLISVIGIIGLLLQKKIGGYEIGGIILVIIMIGVLVTGFSLLFSLIPTISTNPSFNYALNAILHLIIMIIVIRIIAKMGDS